MSDWNHPGLPPHLVPAALWSLAAVCWLFGGMLGNGPMLAFGAVVMLAARQAEG